MSLLSRAGRVLSGQFNGLLERLESPSKGVAQIVVEMAEQLRAARRELVRNVAAEKQLRRKAEQLAAEAGNWARRAELAVRSGEDALAREALAQRRRVKADQERTGSLADQQRGEAHAMKAELQRMESKVAEVKARQGTLGVLAAQARTGGRPEDLGASGDRPFEALSELEDRIDSVEVVFQAQREVEEALRQQPSAGLSAAEVEARFQALERAGAAPTDPEPETQSALDLELAELKQRFRVDAGR